jgi:hypothetical protein
MRKIVFFDLLVYKPLLTPGQDHPIVLSPAELIYDENKVIGYVTSSVTISFTYYYTSYKVFYVKDIKIETDFKPIKNIFRTEPKMISLDDHFNVKNPKYDLPMFISKNYKLSERSHTLFYVDAEKFIDFISMLLRQGSVTYKVKLVDVLYAIKDYIYTL